MSVSSHTLHDELVRAATPELTLVKYARAGAVPFVEYLIKHENVDCTAMDNLALYSAVRAGSTELTQLLLDHGATASFWNDTMRRWVLDHCPTETINLLALTRKVTPPKMAQNPWLRHQTIKPATLQRAKLPLAARLSSPGKRIPRSSEEQPILL